MLKKWTSFTNVSSINFLSFFEMFTIKAIIESENQNQKIASFLAFVRHPLNTLGQIGSVFILKFKHSTFIPSYCEIDL